MRKYITLFPKEVYVSSLFVLSVKTVKLKVLVAKQSSNDPNWLSIRILNFDGTPSQTLGRCHKVYFFKASHQIKNFSNDNLFHLS